MHRLYWLYSCFFPLNSVKVAASIVFVHVAVLDFLDEFPLTFPGLLCVLELQSMLIHGEAHSLEQFVSNWHRYFHMEDTNLNTLVM